MSPAALLDQLRDAGIRLGCTGDDLHADVLSGVDLSRYLEIITRHKEVLLAELQLRERIVGAATVASEAFDRVAFDDLWARWTCLQTHEIAPCGRAAISTECPDVTANHGDSQRAPGSILTW